MKPINTPYQAVVRALYLAVTAPTEEQSKECQEIAQYFLRNLSPEKIEAAKEEAKRLVFAEELWNT